MIFRVTISESNEKLQLDPHDFEGPLNVGDVIEWASNLDTATCQVGNFYPPHCFVPETLTIGPGGKAFALFTAWPPSNQKITYWCTPTAPQVEQPSAQQATDTESYDPGQGIIIVDPPLPGDGDHKDKHRQKKHEREAVIG
jgi:hypothetical protein